MGIIVDSCKDMINQDDKYLEFWSIKVRLESHSNLLDFLKNYINCSQDISIIESQLVKRYLVSQGKFLEESVYLEFWRGVIKEAEEKQLKFEFIASLLLLCRTDKSEFIKNLENLQNMVEQRIFEEVTVKVEVDTNENLNEIDKTNVKAEENTINNVEAKNEEVEKLIKEEIVRREKEKCTNLEKIHQFIDYYVELIYSKTTDVLYKGGEISCINTKINTEKFEKKVCEKYAKSLIMAEKETLSYKDFFFYNYEKLNNLSMLKESLIEIGTRLEDNDLTFNLNHL